jgi:sporulation protein YlmC with PRC-barrel domain
VSEPPASSDPGPASGRPHHGLVPAERVNGTSVYSPDGEKLGAVEDVAIDKLSGQVAYAILSFGGVLGMGERYYPIPWSLLSYDTDRHGYVIPCDKEKLEDAPSFDAQDISGWEDTHVRQSIFDHYAIYGARPYWVWAS